MANHKDDYDERDRKDRKDRRDLRGKKRRFEPSPKPLTRSQIHELLPESPEDDDGVDLRDLIDD